MRELSLNVMDLAQNCITANASLIEIKVEEEGDKLSISIIDNGKGMTEEQVENVIDPFFTTRKTRNVGLGIPLFKLASEQTGGTFSITSETDKGTAIKAEFITSSIDMTPLGDINSTISILIRCNPDIDFVFYHSIDKNNFTLDTRELRNILGDVPLDTPDVIAWIEEFLKENTENIYGGQS